KVDLDHLAAADSDRIADLGNLVVIAPPVVLPAKMAQVFAAAQLDHGEVPGSVRPLGRDPAFERGDAFGREVAACAHVILMPVEKWAVPAAGLVVLHAVRGCRQDAGRDELRRADHRAFLGIEVELAGPIERSRRDVADGTCERARAAVLCATGARRTL